MRTGDLSTGMGKLEMALDTLHAARLEVQASWNDVKFRWFEEHYLAPLEQRCLRAMDAARRLAQVLDKAQRECGPE